MKDSLGIYYYPNPAEISTRMYVRKGQNGVEFRLWNLSRPEVWDKHQWLEFGVIEAAAKIYKVQNEQSNPLLLYDIDVANALLKDEI